LLAALGAFGLAVGLALKDTIADIASGIVLLALRPFEAGDAVSVDGIGGTVQSIDIFQTQLVSFEGVPMMVPNSKVRTARIENYSRAEKRRIDLSVGVAYDANLDEAIEVVKKAMEGDERVLADPAPLVSSEALADSSVNLLVRVWIPPANFMADKLDLLRKVKLELDRAGVEIPFPQRVVHRAGEAA
jgi:small conductance mechanosensitive channel